MLPDFVRGLPVAADGERLAFIFPGQRVRKFRTVGAKTFEWQPAGAPTPPLWPLPPARLPGRIWLAEGESDTTILRCLGLEAYGVTRGATGGLKPAEAEELRRRGVQEVIVVFDADEAGRDGASKLAKVLDQAGLRVRQVDLARAELVDPLAGQKDVRDAWLANPDVASLRPRLEALANAAPPSESHAGGPGVASTDDVRGPTGQRRSQADILAELFCDPRGNAYARVLVGGHCEVWPVRGKAFKRWLAGQYYRAHGKAPNAEALNAALLTLEAAAQFESAPRPVYLRVAPDGAGGVFIDLGDPNWRAIHVTANGWRLVEDPPVCFRRSPGMQALPVPEPGGSIDELRALINVPDDGDWALVKAWLVAALFPRGPYPVLAIRGEQGSAKSTLARMLRALVDPATPELRSDPRDLRDLAIAAEHCWLLALDNVSRIQGWLSDALCRLSTGGGWATRELWTDLDETLFEATRPVILNGITEYITRGDLLDRTIQLSLPPIPEDKRRPEAEVWDAFEAARPRLLGALLDRLVGALRERTNVKLNQLPRMADFALFAVAAERGQGEPPTFLAAYTGARAEADEQELEASPLGATLLDWLGSTKLPWEGTATNLLQELAERGGERATRQTARGLRSELNRLGPALRRRGWSISFH